MTNTLNRLLLLARTHILAIIFALFTGALILGPQLVFIAKEGNHYQGLYMMTTDAEDFYLARMHEFYDEGRVGNPFLYEYKFYGPMFYSYGVETLLAIPGKLLDISIPTLNLIYKFLLPAIGFLLIYALIFRLTGAPLWSLAGALMVFTGLVWFEWEYLKHNLWYTLQTHHLADLWYRPHALYAGRPVHPQFSQIHLFLYLHVLLSVHLSRNSLDWRWPASLGGLLALSFYTYFFSFTFFLALNAVLVSLWFFSGRKVLAGRITLATLGGLVLGLPPLWAIYAAMHHPEYARVAKALWVEPTHAPVWTLSAIALFALLIASYVYAKRNQFVTISRDHLLFLVALMITSAIVINQQVITGITLQYIHYFRSIINPILAVALMFLAAHLFARHHFTLLSRTLPWCVISFLAITGVYFQYTAYLKDAPVVSAEQRYMPAIKWLSGNTPKESVVMANEKLSVLIPVFTENNVMWAEDYIPAGFLVPSERAKFTPENLLKSNNFAEDSKKYRLDYILWDREADPEWSVERYHLPRLFSAEGLEIYALSR